MYNQSQMKVRSHLQLHTIKVHRLVKGPTVQSCIKFAKLHFFKNKLLRILSNPLEYYLCHLLLKTDTSF